jgi:uncharacterized protein (DUF433 family)
MHTSAAVEMEEGVELNAYFDFIADGDIRLRGTRVGIETVLYDYLYRDSTAEQIAERYPTISLEQVYATITWYLHDRQRGDEYLNNWLARGEQARAEQARNPSPGVARFQQLKAESLASAGTQRES